MYILYPTIGLFYNTQKPPKTIGVETPLSSTFSQHLAQTHITTEKYSLVQFHQRNSVLCLCLVEKIELF